MAQSGYTPIQLYSSTTPGNQPTAGNLITGELALNVADGKLYYKNTSGVVTTLAGLSGYSGYSGISGYSGYSGSGVSGYSGYSGATGTGTSGYSGYSGYSGTNGASILNTVNNFTNTNTFATTVSVGSTATPGTLYVKGGNSNNLLVDNAGQQFTTISLYNNGTEKAQMYWDQTNSLFVFGTDANAPSAFKTNTTERMRISATGGVSIGTTTDPGVGNLLVNGTAKANNVIFSDGTTQSTAFVGTLLGTSPYTCAIGVNALVSNTTGDSNLAVGTNASQYNTTGSYNVALGPFALQNNTTGNQNVAIGSVALRNNTADNNTAIGNAALEQNTTGTQNLGIGTASLTLNTTGSYNTGFGVSTLTRNTTGSYNTAIGIGTLGYCTTGINNSGVGYGAGTNVSTGGNNVFFGYVSGADAVANITTQSNYVVLGNNSTTNANIKVAWTVTSDARDKTNISPVTHGLNFVSKLNPVSYQFVDNRADKNAVGDVKYGFLAQDILALEGDNPIIINNKDVENLKYNGESLVPVLVKAIQELNLKIIALETQLGN